MAMLTVSCCPAVGLRLTGGCWPSPPEEEDCLAGPGAPPGKTLLSALLRSSSREPDSRASLAVRAEGLKGLVEAAEERLAFNACSRGMRDARELPLAALSKERTGLASRHAAGTAARETFKPLLHMAVAGVSESKTVGSLRLPDSGISRAESNAG